MKKIPLIVLVIFSFVIIVGMECGHCLLFRTIEMVRKWV